MTSWSHMRKNTFSQWPITFLYYQPLLCSSKINPWSVADPNQSCQHELVRQRVFRRLHIPVALVPSWGGDTCARWWMLVLCVRNQWLWMDDRDLRGQRKYTCHQCTSHTKRYIYTFSWNLIIKVTIECQKKSTKVKTQPWGLGCGINKLRFMSRNVMVLNYPEECRGQNSSAARRRSRRLRCWWPGAQSHLVPAVPASAGWQWHSLGGWWS